MGRLVRPDGWPAAEQRPLARSDVSAFFRGEKTLAELEGMTWSEAQSIAQMGCELAAEGKLEEARVLFEGLVASNPKDAAARAALGTVYQKLGRLSEAAEEYEGALVLDALHPVALLGRGELRLRGGLAGAVEDLQRTVDVDPEGTTAAGRRARQLLDAVGGTAEAGR